MQKKEERKKERRAKEKVQDRAVEECFFASVTALLVRC
jgi:hypothetical protein